MSRIIVIGGGAAGMMAAIKAAENKHEVILLEKNEKLGKKIFITGKGRCNITNASDVETILNNVVTNRKFLYSAIYSFTNEDVMNLFNSLGCTTKVERGNRVFPVSDHSSDVIGALERCMRKLKVEIRLNTNAAGIVTKEGHFEGVKLSNGSMLKGDAVVIATGGLSYPTTGSTGDGYKFARELGHRITPLMPSLVSMHVEEEYIKELAGLSLRNIAVRMTVSEIIDTSDEKEQKKREKKLKPGKELYSSFGELLFTHFGVSGPTVLSASSLLLPYLTQCRMKLHIDLKPALTIEQLDTRILRDFDGMKNKQFKNSLDSLLPQKLIGIIIRLSQIPPEKQVNAITKEERTRLCELLKNLTFHISRFGGYNEAVITKGGIDIKEVDPSTMESKFCKGVYFAGEVLDLDALTGGYNLQIAWSTGAAAGNHR